MQVDFAVPADVDKLAEFLGILFSRDHEFTPNIEKQKAGLSMILSDDKVGKILVLKDNGIIIGMVSLLVSVSTALGGRVAVLEDMFVDEAYRNRGCGGMLLDAAITFARESGFLRITLLTDFDNEGAQRFYNAHGFSVSQMIPLRILF